MILLESSDSSLADQLDGLAIRLLCRARLLFRRAAQSLSRRVTVNHRVRLICLVFCRSLYDYLLIRADLHTTARLLPYEG